VFSKEKKKEKKKKWLAKLPCELHVKRDRDRGKNTVRDRERKHTKR